MVNLDAHGKDENKINRYSCPDLWITETKDTRKGDMGTFIAVCNGSCGCQTV